MNFIKIHSKSIALAAILCVAGGQHCPMLAVSAPAYTATIEGIHNQFDKIVDDFQATFSDFFSNKTKKWNETADEIEEAECVIKEFVAALKAKECELKVTKPKKDADLHEFIVIVLKVSDELEKHFNKIYTTLRTSLNKKLKATQFTKKLAEIVNVIATDENFQKIDTLLAELQRKAPAGIAYKVLKVRGDIKNMFQQYKNNAKSKAAEILNFVRSKLPY